MKINIYIFMIGFVLSTFFANCTDSVVSPSSKILTLKNNSLYHTSSANFYGINQETNPKFDPTPQIIASIPEEKIYLYALQEKDGFYKGMVLSINGVNKFYDWKAVVLPAWMPELHYVDLNGDNKKELVILLIEISGTGLFINKVHIINPENVSEYKVKGALDIIRDNIDIRILSKKEMEIKINNTIYNAKIGYVPHELRGIYPSEIKKYFFRDYIQYYMEDDILKAKVGVEIRLLSYLGHIFIDYSFKDDEFKADKIEFKGNETVTVTTCIVNKLVLFLIYELLKSSFPIVP